jgi:hypothetical protein
MIQRLVSANAVPAHVALLRGGWINHPGRFDSAADDRWFGRARFGRT